MTPKEAIEIIDGTYDPRGLMMCYLDAFDVRVTEDGWQVKRKSPTSGRWKWVDVTDTELVGIAECLIED